MHTTLDAPEKRELNSHERARLAELAGLQPEAFCRLTIEEIRSRFGWQIDPRLLLFRRLSGRVLSADNEIGNAIPVPEAVIRVDSTLSDLLHFADNVHGGGCVLMTNLRRETITTLTTSSQGEFSLWIPRFDIESLARWRTYHDAVGEVLSSARSLRRNGAAQQFSGPKQAVHLERVADVPDIGFRVTLPGVPEHEASEEFHFEVQWNVGAIAPVDLLIQNTSRDPRAFRHGIDHFSIHTGRAGNMATGTSVYGRRRAG